MSQDDVIRLDRFDRFETVARKVCSFIFDVYLNIALRSTELGGLCEPALLAEWSDGRFSGTMT